MHRTHAAPSTHPPRSFATIDPRIRRPLPRLHSFRNALPRSLPSARRRSSGGSGSEDPWGAGAYAFVVQNSPGGGDDDGLLPGLCLLAEKWLRKAAFPLFVDTAASPPALALAQYFGDTRVEALIAVYDEKQADAAAAAGGFGAARGRLLIGDDDDDGDDGPVPGGGRRGVGGVARRVVTAAIEAVSRLADKVVGVTGERGAAGVGKCGGRRDW